MQLSLMQATKLFPEDITLDTIMSKFSTDGQARKFLESWLWPNGPTCPRCKSNDPARIAKANGKSAREGLYRCNDCLRTFTATVGTIFEDSHIPIRKWIIALFLICSSKKGFSSLQMQRVLGLGSYHTAHFLTQRIRHTLKETS
jgi:transposase-like protein